MTSAKASTKASDWQLQASEYLLQGEYRQAGDLYESAIALEPLVKSHYWHLGLMLLLQGQEAEAQTTWLVGMADGSPEEIEIWTTELMQVLQTEATRQESLPNCTVAWAIRQHMQEIAPEDVNNLLHIIALSIHLEKFSCEYLTESGIIELLQAEESVVDSILLLLVMKKLLNYAPENPAVLTFFEASLHHAKPPEVFIDMIINEAIKIAYSAQQPTLASRFAEWCLHLAPNKVNVLEQLTCFYQDSYQYDKGIETAKRSYELAETLIEKYFNSYLLIRAFMSASGYWEEACSTLRLQESLLLSLVEEGPANIAPGYASRIFTSTYSFPYFNDDIRHNRLIHNQVARLCYDSFQAKAKDFIDKYRHPNFSDANRIATNKVLKIGYISHNLRAHSVGWISRWLFQHHDREKFQVYTYLVGYQNISNFVQQWFIDTAYRSYRFETPNEEEIVKQIQQDEIDILVDLDSITYDIQCRVLIPKVAPIQVTWLGWDASGLPSVDYFIADPYVLPENAQDYYIEKIWRLPNTYVAVDGFEVGVPTLRREQLDIPRDAVIYFVAQGGYKRNPDNVRLQMRVLKEVPNSYLLIKGFADEESSKIFFEQIAEEVGVGGDRLRFLPIVTSELVHRANLGIADVVLDTYPYNGATTTLETLWMCLPLVTRVGEQFAARNSYTMMMNAGITEGIAWTDEEYVEWGVRLGKDAVLRQEISWKLRQSRQTAPLWNAKQFTREMEKAYEQMWQKYISAS